MTKTLEPEEPETVDPFDDATAEERIAQLQDEIDAFCEQVNILSCLHPLYRVYKSGKHWIAEYHGKGGRMRATGCLTAQEGLDWVTWMKERVTE